MSFGPLLEGSRDHLRTTLRPMNILPDEVQVMPDGKTTADCGQVFVAVFNIDLGPSEESGNAILATTFGLGVGLTVRTREIPVDRRGEYGYTDIGKKSIISIEELTRQVIKSIHGQWGLMIKANNIGKKLGIRYEEPLYLARSIGTPEEKGPDHFNVPQNVQAQDDFDSGDYEGLYVELVFQGAKSFSHAVEFI